jgi:hypothetical protein
MLIVVENGTFSVLKWCHPPLMDIGLFSILWLPWSEEPGKMP